MSSIVHIQAGMEPMSYHVISIPAYKPKPSSIVYWHSKIHMMPLRELAVPQYIWKALSTIELPGETYVGHHRTSYCELSAFVSRYIRQECGLDIILQAIRHNIICCN